jgi:CheY-like chemotaxis protein
MRPPSPSYAVLIVEDDRDIREILANYLREVGYNVATASNGCDALEQLANRSFAVILMDLSMPVMDGRELGAALRRLGNQIPVILMTAERIGAAVVRELVAAACLVKLFSVDALLELLARVLPSPPRQPELSVQFLAS